jgi:hypothetical protein
MPIEIKQNLKILKQALVAKQNFIKTIIKIFGCYKSDPLKMNLVLEIRKDQQKDLDSLPSVYPLFPRLPHPLHDYSTAPCTS